ncbi:OmpA family protein [Brevibacterium sp. 50QC2O2]|uniref:OmpA family protein n=1 Tax=Brevibacterium sp. 50QC2O2 TaxID=2968459 RepID=UPI00211BD34E|nr:OmpA family protein [Brevibacterium sp. 50QC2O2]
MVARRNQSTDEHKWTGQFAKASTLSAVGLLALSALTLPGLGPPANAAPAESEDQAASEDMVGPEDQAGASATAPGTASVPLAGTFTYHADGNADGAIIHGAIHSVSRIPGGTAVYFSVGGPGVTAGAVDRRPGLDEDYNITAFRSVAIIDSAGLKRYQPLAMGKNTCACSDQSDLSRYDGTAVPLVGYAVLPSLPPDVKTVTVEFGFGNLITGVPVDTAPPTPAVDAGIVPLGHGWPRLPDQQQLAKADSRKYTRDLVRNSRNGAQTEHERSGSTRLDLNSDVLFDTDKATLRPDAKATVADVAKRLADKGTGTVQVTGYTDDRGSDSHNLKLSKDRADSVVKALRAQVHKAGLTFETAGSGEKHPVASNDTEQGRQQNRRVAVEFSSEGGS